MHFVDTNVLVYARDDAEPWKRNRARTVMARLWQAADGRRNDVARSRMRLGQDYD